jgi:hypothetical protein
MVILINPEQAVPEIHISSDQNIPCIVDNYMYFH